MKKPCTFIATIFLATIMLFSVFSKAEGQTVSASKIVVNAPLKANLEGVYMQWRASMIKKNYNLWSQYTAVHKQISVRNRILSEKRPFPATIFALPAAPPSLKGLKALRVEKKGATAKMVYFGKVDFGVGGKPTDNILILDFVYERRGWKYSNADFMNLNVMKKERKQLLRGNYTFIEQAGFSPSGNVPIKPISIRGAQYIAKVYVFCPGRDVKVKVNKISDHRFQNNKISEVVIGGARNGHNEVSYAITSLKGSTGKEALTIRVYLMSTVRGVKPQKVFEYQVEKGGKVKPWGSGNFIIGPKEMKKLMRVQ